MIQGLLLVDKPVGISSFRVVSKVRGIIKQETGQKIKVGHSGTLDPLASGLLVLAIGAYTKKLPNIIGQQKTYIAEATLGKTSSTGDGEGQITDIAASRPADIEIKDVLNSFVGDQMQTPPAYSAVKVNGVRAYKLARKGVEPKIDPKQISIKKIENLSYKYPVLKFKTTVSSGTYIRVLVEDIGNKLNTGAYMSSLVRTEIGQFKLSDAVQLDELNYSKIANSLITLEK